MTTEDAVRELAARLKRRHRHIEPAELDRDPEFEEAIALLADPAEPLSTATALARKGAILSAIALAAIARRGEKPPRKWADWAVKALVSRGPGHDCYLFRALAGAADADLLPGVFHKIQAGWLDEPVRPAFVALVEVRIAAGEKLTEANFEFAFVAEEEPLVLRLAGALSEPAREVFEPPLRAWRRTLVGADWFRGFARIPDLSGDERVALVGGRERVVDLVLDAVTADPPRSILVLGEHGSGKTALVREAIRRLDPAEWFVFEATASDVMTGQSYIGELEGRLQAIAERCRGRKAVWLFPDFEEAVWAGQWARGPRGVLDRLLPMVAAGDVRVVGMLRPSAYELVLRQRPQTGTVFDSVRLPELDANDTVAVARDWLDAAGVAAPPDGELREMLDTASHYLPDTAAPGNLIRLLRLTHERGGAVTARGALEALGESTGLPLHVLDPATPLDAAAARAFFTGRVLGQPEAVDCLVERIAMVKAGLTDPTRPLGVFLFVGPTGTGKTEIAKALAEYLFGSPDRLVRLDMSEYQTWDSFERLLGGGDGLGEASPLLSSVRAQPFSVVLLDEVEKAARPVHDLFLQVFDDGRLTDRAGKTADFRHCVIVLTSNVGSAIRSRPGLGFSGTREPFDPAAVERAVEGRFRPELLNRLDRVVVFRPLGREVMRSLLEKELASVLGRRGFRSRPWAVEWDDAALDFLIDRGFSETYGARPLRRAIDRHLLAPLALEMAGQEVPQGDQFLFISARDGAIDVAFIDPDGDDVAVPSEVAPGGLAQVVSDPRGTPEEAALLLAELRRIEDAFAEWRERKGELLERMHDPAFWASDERVATLALAEYLDRFDAALGTAVSLAGRISGRTPAARVVAVLAGRLYVLDRALAGLEEGDPAEVVLALRPTAGAGDFARELAGMYAAWAQSRGMRIERLALGGDDLAFAVSGLGASTILAGETGLHVLEEPGEPRGRRVGVHVAIVPAGDDVREALTATRKVVRRYRRKPSPLVRDSRGWRTGRLDRVLAGDFDVQT